MKIETVIQLSLVFIFFVIWQVLADLSLIPSYLLGTPIGALNALSDYLHSSTALGDIEITLFEALFGLFLGILFGVLCGIVVGSSDRLSHIFAPIFSSFMGIPKIVLAPFIILAFGGISPTSKVFLAFYGSFLIIFHTIHSGIRVIDRKYLVFFEVYNASKTKILRKLYLPYSMIWLIQSLKLALPMAFAGAIVGEFLASVKGLGVRLVYYESLFYPDGVLAITFLIVAMILSSLILIQLVENRVLEWRKA